MLIGRLMWVYYQQIQSNLVVSNSVNWNLRLYRCRTLVTATNHYKRREKHRIYQTWIYRISGYIEQTALPEGSTIVYIECRGSSAVGCQVSEMRYLPSLSGQTRAGRRRCHLSQAVETVIDIYHGLHAQAMPRLPLPSAGCCICLRALRKTLSKQLQQQQVDFMLSEPDEQQRSLMKRPSSVNSSSGFTLVAELEQLPADSHVMTLDYSPGDDYWLFLS